MQCPRCRHEKREVGHLYAYYGTSANHGAPHHLQTATVKDAAGNVTDTSYYRWYTSGTSAGLMSRAFGAAAYARLTAVPLPESLAA